MVFPSFDRLPHAHQVSFERCLGNWPPRVKQECPVFSLRHAAPYVGSTRSTGMRAHHTTHRSRQRCCHVSTQQQHHAAGVHNRNARPTSYVPQHVVLLFAQRVRVRASEWMLRTRVSREISLLLACRLPAMPQMSCLAFFRSPPACLVEGSVHVCLHLWWS